MPGASASEPNFFQQYGYIIWPIFGVLGGIILLGCAYAVWRGPQRAFLPACLVRRMRKNVVDSDGDDEKHFPGMGRVPSPVPIPARRETARRNRRGEVISSADEFKQQVVAARQSQNWADSAPNAAFVLGEAEGPGSPASTSGTLVGSDKGEKEEMAYDYNDEHHVAQLQYNDGTTPMSDLPRRRSSIDAVQYAFADGSPLSSVSIYPSAPPPVATAPLVPARRTSDVPAAPAGPPPRRTSVTPAQYQPRVRDQRETRRYPTANPHFSHNMKDDYHHDVW